MPWRIHQHPSRKNQSLYVVVRLAGAGTVHIKQKAPETASRMPVKKPGTKYQRVLCALARSTAVCGSFRLVQRQTRASLLKCKRRNSWPQSTPRDLCASAQLIRLTGPQLAQQLPPPLNTRTSITKTIRHPQRSPILQLSFRFFLPQNPHPQPSRVHPCLSQTFAPDLPPIQGTGRTFRTTNLRRRCTGIRLTRPGGRCATQRKVGTIRVVMYSEINVRANRVMTTMLTRACGKKRRRSKL